eukprot:scaffold273_cov242-Pinguiococcus_pyrenoidosus.AAC.44
MRRFIASSLALQCLVAGNALMIRGGARAALLPPAANSRAARPLRALSADAALGGAVVATAIASRQLEVRTKWGSRLTGNAKQPRSGVWQLTRLTVLLLRIPPGVLAILRRRKRRSATQGLAGVRCGVESRLARNAGAHHLCDSEKCQRHEAA